MSQQLINHSPDLKKLQDEGLEVNVHEGYLIISGIPYANSKKEISLGTLVSDLDLSGSKTTRPKTHVVYFIGEQPCHKDGKTIEQIRHQDIKKALTKDISIDRSFSNKPKDGYADYYEKMKRYIQIISAPAKSLDPSVTEKTFKVIKSEDENDVFNYIDTNSSRAEINVISDKLRGQIIGIIGLGGTGAYVLDFIAKTPVQEIHLFDGDDFLQHNAFRAPGAPSQQKLNKKHLKIKYLKSIYSNMHRGIKIHSDYIDSSNLEALINMDYVFICIDDGRIKSKIFTFLEENGIIFIDVGIGLEIVDDKLIGIVRTTTSTPKKRKHIKEKISLADGDNDEYSTNIQIAELNALNASLAVIKWKKLCRFYQDLEDEHHSTYTLNVNLLTSDENNET